MNVPSPGSWSCRCSCPGGCFRSRWRPESLWSRRGELSRRWGSSFEGRLRGQSTENADSWIYSLHVRKSHLCTILFVVRCGNKASQRKGMLCFYDPSSENIKLIMKINVYLSQRWPRTHLCGGHFLCSSRVSEESPWSWAPESPPWHSGTETNKLRMLSADKQTLVVKRATCSDDIKPVILVLKTWAAI